MYRLLRHLLFHFKRYKHSARAVNNPENKFLTTISECDEII